jgi:hypothetical protein
MPKKPRASEYEVRVDKVIEPGRVAREGKITVVLGPAERGYVYSSSRRMRFTSRTASWPLCDRWAGNRH